MKKSITQLFNKFAGREVAMTEIIDFHGGCLPEVTVAPDLRDPTFQEMEKVARENNLTLRLIWPDKAITDDFGFSRVNAHIEKGQDGKWRVGKDFTVG